MEQILFFWVLFLGLFLNSSLRFIARILPFSDYNHLIKPKKLVDQNLEFLPGFPSIAQKAQNSPKFENRSYSSFNFVGRTFISSGIVDLPKVQKLWNRFLIYEPRFLGYGPKWPKTVKIELCFLARFLNFSHCFYLATSKICWTENFDLGAHFWGYGGPENRLNFRIFVIGRMGFKC